MKNIFIIYMFFIINFNVLSNSFSKLDNNSNILRSINKLKLLSKEFVENNICKYEIAVKIADLIKKNNIELSKNNIILWKSIILKLKKEFNMLGLKVIIVDNNIVYFSNSYELCCSLQKNNNNFKKTLLFKKHKKQLFVSK